MGDGGLRRLRRWCQEMVVGVEVESDGGWVGVGVGWNSTQTGNRHSIGQPQIQSDMQSGGLVGRGDLEVVLGSQRGGVATLLKQRLAHRRTSPLSD